MKKLLISFCAMAMFALGANAKTVKSDFSSVLKESGVDTESIAISIKSASGKTVYSLNEKILMSPASVQKVLTTPVIAETLGDDYEFSTEIYSRGNDEYILKLGADPYLSSKELRQLINQVSVDTKKLYIDDSILDSKTWGEGWQWDDDMNVLMPKFGAYNLDKNLIKLTIMPPQNGQFATIINPAKYPLVFFNNITKGDKTNLDIHRDSAISENTIVLAGTVARPTTVYIPVSNIKRNFELQTKMALENRKVYLKTVFTTDKVKDSDKIKAKITRGVEPAINDVLKNSNNMVSETIFKLAGGKYCGLETGTDSSGVKMFNDYCVKHKIDNSRIRITDGSGVSKNNLVSTNFVSDFLLVNKDNKIMQKLPTPGEGTLTHRMLPLKGNLRAKTGTLSDVSSIAGYLEAKSGHKYVFCIINNDMKLSNSDKKALEDYILREAYLRL
ncbi:MAG: D-alanyl-D-alanine carboxypeptidase/D-alanyl-D-alanine-endopeptidase [Candidatus Gastranaerophilales bacterium]|nr:D-alanyl-D-alanine carboxypeptidase/D-alanyl-D-alanine-endopeptidase [Candidatus Gastranaerophilales bacterium]MCM1072388.1 D-alanyl-D-alanine carboxypeptidase/D-alanyl-D-alanine-endopeptidase [Bacteroides sp.]